MPNTGQNKDIITHDFPVWRDKSDFIIAAELNEQDISDLVSFEQIWARQASENTFVICCVPFLAYHLALGDLVETKASRGRKYVISRVMRASGRYTFRIWFEEIDIWKSLIQEIESLGCLVEIRWHESSLIAADAPDLVVRNELEACLKAFEEAGKIRWEISV